MQQVQKYDTDIANSLLSNAGTRICFRLGDTDARRLQEGFASFNAEDLQNLATGEAIMRVNTVSADCSLTVIPYENTGGSFKDDIIKFSRDTYSDGIPTIVAPPVSKPVEPPPEKQQQPIEPIEPVLETVSAEPQEHMREHRYLQLFIKKLAEERSYIANTEVPTPDGQGQVDVLLEKGGQHIAVEISITTSAEWELHNIQKCLNAGYGHVVVCANTQSKVQQIQKLIRAELTVQEKAKVQVITAEHIHELFVQESHHQETTAVIKGYRVKVQYEQSGSGNTAEMLQRIINTGKR